jgi:hypothetical protein
MRLIYFLILFLILFACQEKKEEIVDFDDLNPSSKRDFDKKNYNTSDEGNIYFADSLQDFTIQLIDSFAFDKKNIAKIDTLFFPDRFGASSSEKWYLKTEKDSMVFFHWTFKDSIKTFNTFYNWLDCYGEKCQSIRVGDKAIFSKRAACFFVENKDLYYVESTKMFDFERFLKVFDKEDVFYKMKYIVLQKPRKKAEWFSRNSEGILLPFQKEVVKK